MTPTLITISGPTCVGKTSFSIELAKKIDSEIISFDSRQFYREMSIGTAVPSKDELNSVKHHFIQHKSIHEIYTINDYTIDFDNLIKKSFNKSRYIVLVGGSNLYLKSVIYGLDNIPQIPKEIRFQLNFDYKKKGITYLQNMLKKLDYNYYKNVDIQNHRRLIRALEVSIFTKKPFSDFLSSNKKEKYNNLSVVMNIDRSPLYKLINSRVDKMLESGLLDEAKRLHKFKDLNALNTIGYKELFEYFEGRLSYEDSKELIKTNSRRFAKKQLTWLNNNGSHLWIKGSESIKNNLKILLQKIL